MPDENTYLQVHWRSRRGMLELDVLLIPFSRDMFNTLSYLDKVQYIRLLDCEDPDLFQWLIQKNKPKDNALAAIVTQILDYQNNKLCN